jgi:hypothetical protein
MNSRLRKNTSQHAVDVPVVLYKYRSWNEHSQAMINGQVFFAKRESLNDPFEYRWLVKRPETFERAVELAAILIKQSYPHLNEADDEFKFHWKNITDQIWNNFDPFYKMFRHVQQGVFCACKFNDDIRMWSHYASNHTGVCIGFRTKGFGRRFAPVLYKDQLPVFDGIELFGPKAKVNEAVAIKSLDWEYENEWRTFFTPGVRQLKKGIIAVVVIGCEMPRKERNEVVQFTRNSDSSIELYEAKLSDTAFRLDIVPI